MKINIQKITGVFFIGSALLSVTQVNGQCAIPTNVTATPSLFCAPGGTTNLNATSVGNSISWYTVPVGGAAIGSSASGANFNTNCVTTTTYYAESFSIAQNTFNFTGGMQTYTVPGGLTTLTIDVRGARGGMGYDPYSNGGNGGRITGTIAVVPGQVLNIYVGGIGGNGGPGIPGSAGFNGGGTGASYPGAYAGGGGGGASDIRVSPYALANRVAVAGGGGGGALDYFSPNYERGGMGGGLSGEGGYHGNVLLQSGYPGGGGTQGAGGTAGNYPGYCVGFVGNFGVGGNGGSCTNSGGGGGGGYYGGGGGVWGGGGGGSSFLVNAVHTQGFQNGAGQVIITGSGCVSVSRTPVVVSVTPSPTITITGNTQICVGGTVNLTANGATNYTWSTGALTPTISASPVVNTSYTVTGSNGGCSSTAVQIVTVTPSPNITITGGSSLCIGSTLNLTANGAATYTWSNGVNTNTNAVSPLVNTTYTVVGTNTAGCTSQTVQAVTVNTVPVVAISGQSATCVGAPIVLTGSGANTYSWSTGAITSTVSVAPVTNTTYTLIGTSALGCTASASHTVSVFPLPIVSISGPTQVCIGNSINLTANGAASYTWSTGAQAPNISASPVTNTVYSVVGLDAVTGCTASASQNITVNQLPVVAIAGSNTLCQGSTLNLTANGASTYTWDNGANTNTIAPTPSANVSYTVFGTNTLTGCFNSAVHNVTVNAIPTLTATGPSAMCAGQTINLNGFGANSYTWSTGATFSTIAVSPTANVSYTLTGSSNLGCAGTPFVKNITVNPIPVVSISATSSVICKGETVLLTGTGVNTYSWNNGALTSTINITPSVTTSYTVQGTNTTTGCYNNAVITIQVSLCTGIGQPANIANEISVYPNPNNGEFAIELKNGLNKTVEVYDMIGRNVLTISGQDDKLNINISDLNNGIYYVKIYSGSSIEVVKVVKQ